jgi:hypothetical protein
LQNKEKNQIKVTMSARWPACNTEFFAIKLKSGEFDKNIKATELREMFPKMAGKYTTQQFRNGLNRAKSMNETDFGEKGK